METAVELEGHAGPVVVRPARSADVSLLAALYRRLPLEDRYGRFFSGGQPATATLRRWVAGGEQGAVFVGVEAGVAVADAGVVAAPDGVGDLGLAVEPGHRGWLGPFLLDRVLRAAATRGIAAVRADVLTVNAPMLRLLVARGHAVLPTDDPAVVRLLVATEGRIPPWPPAQRGLRVLVEAPGGRWVRVAELVAAGHDVVACPVPTSGPRPRCPLIAGRPCRLVAGADVVVVSPSVGSTHVDALRRAHPDAVVCEAAAR